MSALATEKARRFETWKHHLFLLAAGSKAYKGGIACIDLSAVSTSKVVPGSSSPTLLKIGIFDETIDATAAAQYVNVDLEREITVEWYSNGAAGNAVAATDVGRDAYVIDDQTVGIAGAGRCLAGRIWAFDSVRNAVAVEKVHASASSLAGQPGSLIAYVANDSIPTSVASGAIYDVPTTAAPVTITLPAAAADGTIAYFVADGVKNGHTVQYRDATGAVNLTTALTASKRHEVIAVKYGGKWFANAYVSP